jgi:hypothetical protein
MTVWAVGEIAPGRWEISTKVAVPKLPFGLNIPRDIPLPQSATRRVCITEEDIERPQALVKAQTGCVLQELLEAEGEFRWKAICDGPPRSRSAGRLTVNGETLLGTATVATDIQGLELPVSIRYSGRRLGQCSR